MLKEILASRKLPPFQSREKMLEILQTEEYGFMPKKPDTVSWKITEKYIPSFCAGKAISRKVDITVDINGGRFTFPVYASIPSKEGCHPFFVCINFRDCVPDRYIPVEEIVDNGFGVLSFCYNDVTTDNADFTNGLAGVLFKDGKRAPTDPGKIAIWAWAAQRVLDYAESCPVLDMTRAVVCGHSRLGKTALLAAATDERFFCGYSNDSGCSGAAITRDKVGERVEDIYRVFPYWFCENYGRYVGKEAEMPFDQHFLTACIAPRYVYVASAAEDKWADPDSEMLNCASVDEYFRGLSLTGFVSEDRLPEIGDTYHDGHVGYHLRAGSHYLGREDWQKAMAYLTKHFPNKK